jgi:LPXTG-motif cell wall-anchored protein
MDRDVPLAGRTNLPVDIVLQGSPPSSRPDLIATGAFKRVDQCAPFEALVVLALNPNGPERFATVQGRFLSPTGEPIGNARFRVDGTTYTSNSLGQYSARITVGRQNAITGAEPAPRTVFPLAEAGGFDQYGPTDWWSRSYTLTLAANEVRDLDVVLTPVRYGTIRGVVVDAATNEPLPGRTVDLSSTLTNVVSFPRRVTTDAAGRFESSGMRQRETGTSSGGAASLETSTHWSGRASALFAGDPLVVDLVVPAIRKCAPASLVGVVVDNATGAPLADVTVRLSTGEQTLTGADGRFSMGAGPFFENLPREVTVTASKTGFVTSSRQVWIFCGATLVVDFAPQPPTTGSITGLVTDSAGTPLPGIFVGSEYGGGTTTGSDGRYTLTGAPPNPDGSARPWKVTALPTDVSGLLPASVTVSVAGGQTVTADLVLLDRDTAPPPNTPPSAVITPSGTTVAEGTVVTFDASSSTDFDGDPLTFSWDLDADGSPDGAAATFPVRFGSPGVRTVKLTVSDGRGGATSTQVAISVTNVAPAVVAGDDATVGPDGAFSRSARFDDPGDGDAFTATVDWGDGGGPVPLPRFARTLDLDHTFPGLGSYRVVVRVCDASNECGEGAFTVTVSSTPPNQPPVATIAGPSEVTEGTLVTFDASGSSDPEGQALTYGWDLDADGELDDGTGPTVTFTASTAGTWTVVVSVTDPAGATTLASVQLTVTGSAPTIDAIADQRVGAGVPLSLTAVVRDTSPAPGGYTATVDWGDGAGAVPVAFVAAGAAPGSSGLRIVRQTGVAAVGTVPLVRTFGTASTYQVVVRVCDSSCSEVRFQVLVTPAVIRLPATGATTTPTLWLGLGALGLGVAVLGLTRRRRPA